MRDSYDKSKTATYEKAVGKIKKKADKIQSRYFDIFHRKILINQSINPIGNHVCMVFGESQQFTEFLDKIRIKILWDKKEGGNTRKGRRLVAKKRIQASNNRGGLDIPAASTIWSSLGCNLMQRLKEGEDKEGILYIRIFKRALENIMYPTLGELQKYAGSKIWIQLAKRLENKYPTYSWAIESTGKLLQLSEESNQGWMAAGLAGHEKSSGVYEISRLEGYTLLHYGLTHILQLFPERELTAGLDLSRNIEYPPRLMQNHPFLVEKCKKLRSNIAKTRRNTNLMSTTPFFKAVEGTKLSGLYRKLAREKVDNSIPGPPSFFTRKRDGIAVPSLKKYMKGYDNIKNTCISSKTRETAYLVMNRQIWTNFKGQKVNENRGQNVGTDQCGLCNEIEDTQHILFSCQKYSVMYWEIFSEMISKWIKESKPEHATYYIHLYNIMYNVEITGVPTEMRACTAQIIQEIKRDMIYRRYKRCENAGLNQIRYSRSRILAHMSLIVRKYIGFLKYKGRTVDNVTTLYNIILNEV